MISKKKHIDIYMALAALLTILVVIMRIASFEFFDFSLGRYSDTALAAVGDWITFASAVLILSHLAIAPREAKYRAVFTGARTYVPTALVCAALVFLSFSLFSSTLSDLRRPINVAALRDLSVLLPLVCGTLALVSVLYFFLNSYVSSTTSERRAFAAFFAIIFLCVYPAYLYFDSSLPINAPAKLIDQMAYLFCAIFFLYEARISLGRDRWGAYVAFGLIASLLTAYSAIPSVVVYFTEGKVISNSIAETVLTLSLFVFIIFRLNTVRSLYDDTPSEIVTAIIAKSREQYRKNEERALLFSEGEQMEFEMTVLATEETDEGAEKITEAEAEDIQSAPLEYESAEELLDITENEESDTETQESAE